MRIIAGEGHGRKLKVPKGGETRSTASRVKQTYFDIMRAAIEDSEFLDACSGSGALGIEAVSRGAAHATLIDRSHAAVASALENIRALGARSRSVEVLQGDLLRTLRKLRSEARTFDLVYLDPPFNSNAAYNVLDKSPEGASSEAQIEAFDDTWHWNETAERAFDEVMESGNTDAAEMLRAMRSFLGLNDMMAYLAMMAVRLIELHRVLRLRTH